MPTPSTRLRRGLKSIHRQAREFKIVAKGLLSTRHPLQAHVIPMRRCNLACAYCNEYDDFSKPVPLQEMQARLDHLRSLGTSFITISGGEPLLQASAMPLMKSLCDDGFTVLLETSGAHDLGPVDPRVHIIMDLKCPDSGESAGNRWANLDLLKPTDQIKFVIASKADFDWTVQTIRAYDLDRRFTLLLSPVFSLPPNSKAPTIPPAELAKWLLESGLQARLQLQLHKFIWDPQARGV